jgi:hypothetical protein
MGLAQMQALLVNRVVVDGVRLDARVRDASLDATQKMPEKVTADNYFLCI